MGGLAWGAILGFIGTTFMALVGLYGQRVYRSIETSKVKVAESEASVDAQRIKLEGWAEMVTSLQAERTALNDIIAKRDATIEKLQGLLYDNPRQHRSEPKDPHD